ncbi:exonuclease domain-containing protein [Carnobacterium gallinarum]|uniref:exonuclease domain-containing protein n=1 Tax=Carnobacterium gallinarum TaxID=2749 RepID=UPI00055335B2|nr:exonuclease domain-containing protein [Carnobacterium gallinarum]
MSINKKYDVATIDFETATNNNYSACSLGMCLIKDLEIVASYSWLIQPPNNRYSLKNTEIHGLSSQDTSTSPDFPLIWPEIKRLLQESHYIAAHNAQFDMSVLAETLAHYQIESIDFAYFDSIPYSTKACAGEGIPNGLKERCQRFNVALDSHHDALSDATACGALLIACTKELHQLSIVDYLTMYATSINVKDFNQLKTSKYFSYPSAKVKRFQTSNLKEINALEKNTLIDNPLFLAKSFVFTGDFTSNKDQLMQQVVEKGGILKSAVSGKTDYVVEGVQDLSIVGDDGLSGKQRKARELIAKGKDIHILTEKQLKEMFK